MRKAALLALSALVAVAPTLAIAEPDVQHIRVTRGGAGTGGTTLALSLNKAAIIDLPADARDLLLSNPEIADAVVRTPRRIYILGRKVGQTNAFFFDAAGRQIANVEINVEPDVAPLNDLFRRYVPNTNATAEAVNGSLVLSGSVKSAAESERVLQIANRFAQSQSGAGSGGPGGASANQQIVNLIAVEGQEQVLVKVRIVEMSRSLVRQLGVNLNAENMLNQLLPEDTFVRVLTQNGYSIAGRALGGVNVTGGEVDGENQIDASIDAFERVGLLRVLAEPNLTAISGEAAKFLAGGEFPVPVQADDGKISVDFKPFGVGLAFTPVVVSPGRISLKLSTEVSELTSEGAFATGDTSFIDATGVRQIVRGITIPALQVRRAETTVEMPAGGALVMAGLIQERTRQAMEGIPGAKDLPVFGQLFRSRDFVNNETELVIIVTPYLVQPTSPDRLRTPADGFRVASERESILNGRLNAMYRAPSGREQGGLSGPHGHIIEGSPKP